MPWKDEARFRAYQAKYNADPVNKERKREWAKKYREANKERDREYRKENHERTREQKRAYQQQRYARDRQRVLSIARAWKQANPHKLREYTRRRAAVKRHATVGIVDYDAIWLASDGLCGICREAIRVYDEIHFDHVVPLSRGGAHSTENIQVSHASCNMKKGAKVA